MKALEPKRLKFIVFATIKVCSHMSTIAYLKRSNEPDYYICVCIYIYIYTCTKQALFFPDKLSVARVHFPALIVTTSIVALQSNLP